MSYLRETAIVLGVHPYKEKDKLALLMTPGYGLIRCVARRAVSPASRLGSSLEMLSLLKVQLFRRSESMEYFTLCQTLLEERSPLLEADFETLACGSFFCELLEAVASPEQPDPDLYELLLHARAMLKIRRNSRQLALAFLLAVMKTQGVTPSLLNCVRCGKPASSTELEVSFSPSSGGVICPECVAVERPGFRLSRSARQFMGMTLKIAVESDQSAEDGKILAEALQKYAEYHLHLKFRSFRFLS